jgi:hypothetical protein
LSIFERHDLKHFANRDLETLAIFVRGYMPELPYFFLYEANVTKWTVRECQW